MEDAFLVDTSQFDFYVPLRGVYFRVLQSLFRDFCKLSLIGEAPDSLQHHDSQHVLTVEAHLEPGSIQNQVDDSVFSVVLDEWEEVLALACIYLFAPSSTEVVPVGSFRFVVTEHSLLVFLSLLLCLPQVVEVLRYVFLDSRSLEMNHAVLEHAD